jgi:thiol:disulfide interchange protein DsbA
MMHRRLLFLALLMMAAPAFAQLRWQEGRHYQVLLNAPRAGAPADKVEVAEAFSYACSHCYRAKGDMAKLAAALPADAAMVYVHASFVPSAAWPMFQRAYYTALKLGIAEATHDGVFRAVWETGEIPLIDRATQQTRQPLPAIEDAAKFYARVTSVKQADFLKVAGSPEIDAAMRRADDVIKQWKVPGTPALVVNGRYLVNDENMSFTEVTQLVQYLITLERTRLKRK